MNTAVKPLMYRWQDVPWTKIQRNIFKLQKRIYQASRCGNTQKMRELQKLLMKSEGTAFLAVRKVTQENRGKRTAGVDGKKELKPDERLKLAQKLQENPYPEKTCPVRRIWIPKPGTKKQRPLGIPTIEDRAHQALAKLALEPEWEAKFEPSSFGFRPGRSTHDAIPIIYHSIRLTPKYVLDADIAKCFDRINHDALLEKLHTFPRMRRTINRWLKAGVMDGGTLFPTEEGTPQGSIVSPLLANVALHGLEKAITQAFQKTKLLPATEKTKTKNEVVWTPKIVRYADDFVVLHRDYETIQKVKTIVAEWLKHMGLELQEEKTRITHTFSMEGEIPGFDFLGFSIRQFRKGQRQTKKGKFSSQYRTLIRPSKKAVTTHTRELSQTIRAMRSSSQEELIGKLNPKIVGWANYQAIGLSRDRTRMDHILYCQLRRWALRRHPKKGDRWVMRKYWRLETGKWIFGTPDGDTILRTHCVKVKRQYAVRNSSIFDGDWVYWSRRMQKYPTISPWRAKLLKMQNGKCAFCGLYFNTQDLMEIDRTIPRPKTGTEQNPNMRLLHAHCRNRKTAREGLVGITVND